MSSAMARSVKKPMKILPTTRQLAALLISCVMRMQVHDITIMIKYIVKVYIQLYM